MIYVIYNMEDSANIDFSKVVETSLDTLRVSEDGTETVLKFEGETPDFLEGVQQYTQEKILEILRTPAWTPQQI
jgi:hypothetical protein